MGFPNVSIEEKFAKIRVFDTEFDWTKKTDDKIVVEHITKYIEISKWLQKECEKYNLPFVDVSSKRNEVLENTKHKILAI